MWLLPNLPLLTIKTQTYSHSFGWNCTNISKQFMHADLYVIREHHTCTWNLWKILRDLKGNSLGSCLIFLNINPQTVSLNIPHVCSAINTWHFCFSFCLLILCFFLFCYFSQLFFHVCCICLLNQHVYKFPWTGGWCEEAVGGDLGLQNYGLLPEWDIWIQRLQIQSQLSLPGLNSGCSYESVGLIRFFFSLRMIPMAPVGLFLL